MADYFNPTVIQPAIPLADMTALERIILSLVFEAEVDGDGLYFSTPTGPNTRIETPLHLLQAACEASSGIHNTSTILAHKALHAAREGDRVAAISLEETSWEFIVQDIVRRSAHLQYVTAVTVFSCSKMRPDAFGGVAVLITPDAITGKSLDDVLEDLMAEAGINHS